jgi:NAD(P)H-nitrite reductase large subunit
MEEYKYLIIGGGVAGTTAAGTIRDKDPDGTIAIISDEPHYLYSRIMLSKPNFFLGKIPFDQIWLRDEDWYKEKKIEFLGGKTAVKLDSENKTIVLDDDQEIKYDKLLISLGVCPRPLPVPGVELKGVHYLRTLDQGKGIIESVSGVKKAIAVGGGFISFEMANMMHLSGAETHIVIREENFWEPILDKTASEIVEKAIESSGVKILRKSEIGSINGTEKVESVTLKDGTEIESDAIICGIGAFCKTEWLEDSGIGLDRGVLADDHLATNLPDIWAAGDGTQFSDPILEEEVQLGNWVNAQEQGRIVGLNMVGEKTPFTFVSFYTTHGFDVSITFIGNVRPQKEFTTIVRHGPADNQHAQLLVVNDELVGAVLINLTPIMQPISKIISQNIKVGEKEKLLADPNFDLNLLLNK